MGLLAVAAGVRAQLPNTPPTFSVPTLVGSSSQAQTVTVAVRAAGSLHSFGSLTTGVAPADPSTADFKVLQSANCPIGSGLSMGQSCQLTVTFSPQYPGVRQGAVQLLDANGTVLGSTIVSGIAQGSLPVLVPGQIATVAGDGQFAYQRDGVPATEAPIFLPTGLAVDAGKSLYFCDSSNNRVRRVDGITGIISTVAGIGSPGSSGDGAAAVTAQLNSPSGLAMDGAGNLYIADTGNSVVRRVDRLSGVITTIAGQIGNASFSGDGGPATSATFSSPVGLAITPGGDLLIADSGNNRVRLLTIATGQIETIAGTGIAGFAGDGGNAAQAQLFTPFGVAVRSDGAIAIADKANHRVRLISPAGILSTVAGTGERSYFGDGGPAAKAKLDNPAAVAFDPAGDLFIADSENNRVRGIFGTPGTIVTVVGNGTTSSSNESVGDTGPSDQASLYGPYALVFDAGGNLWVSDLLHNRVREINGSLLSHTYPAMKVGKLSAPFAGNLYNAGNVNLLLQIPTQSAGLNQAVFDPSTTTCDGSPMVPTAFCVMEIEFAPTQVNDDDRGSVTWVSNAPYVTPVDVLDAKVLSVEPTAVALSASPNPGILGQAVTLTGSVTLTSTGKGSGLTGTVTFSEGSTPLCVPANVNADGNATCLVSSLSLGTHTFVASYSGDANDAAATSAPYTEVIKQQPALALAVSTSPAVVNSNVTLTLVATDTAGSGTPTGTVTFYDGGTALASMPLNGSGIAQFSTQSLTIGTHDLSAQYSGDAGNVRGSSNTVAEQITPANTVTVLASNSSDPMIGSPLTLVATVVSNNGPSPTGTVQFVDGSGAGPLIGVATLTANGTATTTVDTLLPGSHSIVAVYVGDANDAGSRSAALGETVRATGLTLGSSSNPAVSGQNIVISAQLNASGPVAPTGVAVFRENGAILGSVPFDATGLASFATSALSVGTHAITASYVGDSHYAAAGGQLNQVVNNAKTSLSLIASTTPTVYGEPLHLTATVSSNGGVATGTVSFLSGGAALGSAQLDGNGVAVFTLSTLLPGSNTLVASYAGDGRASPSTSTPIVVVVKQATSLSLASNSNPAQTLSSITLVATLATPGAAAATGPISFTDGALALGMAAVDAAGHATLTVPRMSAGEHMITATYAGDGGNLPSASGSYSLIVQQRPTTTTITGSATDTTNPQQITLIAVVKGQGAVSPGGTVAFTNGPVTLGQAAVDNTGVATITVILQHTSQPIVASYTGDVSYSASQSSATTINAGQPAQFTLASDATNLTLITHQHVNLTVSVGSVKGFTDTIRLGCLGLPFASTCTFTPSQVKLSADGTATATLILDTGNPLGSGTGTSASLQPRSSTLLCGLPIGLLVWMFRRKQQNGLRNKLGALFVLAMLLSLTTGLMGCSGLSTSGTPPGSYQFTIVATGQGSGTTQNQAINLVVTQ